MQTITAKFSTSADKLIAAKTDENGNATRSMRLCLVGHTDYVRVLTTHATGNEVELLIPRGGNVKEYINFAIDAAFVNHDETETETETTEDTNEEQEDTMETTTKTTTTTEEQECIMRNTPITASKPFTTTDDDKDVYLDDYADCVIFANSRKHKATVDLCLTVEYQPAYRKTFDGVVYIVPGGEYLIRCADAPEKGDFQITVPAGHNIAATIRKSIKRLYTDDVERDICERFERMCNDRHNR